MRRTKVSQGSTLSWVDLDPLAQESGQESRDQSDEQDDESDTKEEYREEIEIDAVSSREERTHERWHSNPPDLSRQIANQKPSSWWQDDA